METRWNLAITVETCIPARVGEALQFIAFCNLDNPEIGVAVPPPSLKVQSDLLQTILEPILEMKLLVSAADALDQNAIVNAFNTPFEHKGKRAFQRFSEHIRHVAFRLRFL